MRDVIGLILSSFVDIFSLKISSVQCHCLASMQANCMSMRPLS